MAAIFLSEMSGLRGTATYGHYAPMHITSFHQVHQVEEVEEYAQLI